MVLNCIESSGFSQYGNARTGCRKYLKELNPRLPFFSKSTRPNVYVGFADVGSSGFNFSIKAIVLVEDQYETNPSIFLKYLIINGLVYLLTPRNRCDVKSQIWGKKNDINNLLSMS
jgi:hypothetical protein